ncbi:hypothetical protein ALQ20_05135, partial [Pseudomonas syringae pv. atrofaciens]
FRTEPRSGLQTGDLTSVTECSRFRPLSVKSKPEPIDSSDWSVLLGLCILRILGGPSVPQ